MISQNEIYIFSFETHAKFVNVKMQNNRRLEPSKEPQYFLSVSTLIGQFDKADSSNSAILTFLALVHCTTTYVASLKKNLILLI